MKQSEGISMGARQLAGDACASPWRCLGESFSFNVFR